MSALRLKLCGLLNNSDQASLRSMLRLSADRLSAEWQIVDEEPADLEIYSFDSDAGQQAWNQRSQAVTALLSNSGQVSQPVDIVLRKPLRKSNFADALNLVEEKIRLQLNANQKAPNQPENSPGQRHSLGSLLNKLKFRRQPAANLPGWNFSSASQRKPTATQTPSKIRHCCRPGPISYHATPDRKPPPC